MTQREQVHRLVEELSPTELAEAQRYLRELRVRAEVTEAGPSTKTGNLQRISFAPGLRDLVTSWIEGGDADEQEETGEYLVRALDEDRLSDRKLFPEELKGTTW